MNLKKLSLRCAALFLTLILALTPLASAMSVEEARQILRDNYIDPISEDILSLPTIEEITAALGDPFTYYMSADEYQQFENELNDSALVGIGLMVEKRSDGLLVIRVAPGSPAEKGGLGVGDLVVAANGTGIEQAGSPDGLAALITGTKGTSVTITYLRDGTSHDLALTRAEVVFPTVEHKVVDKHIGWITCYSFGEHTGEDFKSYITADDSQADHWVVDLRGNPGGYATAVIQAASHVVGNNDVAYVADKDRNVLAWRVNPLPIQIDPILTDPMIILTDSASASASELYAAAMRDYGTALIIGSRTFGKGVGQNVFEGSDGSVMKVTSFRYYSPNYVTPDHSGVLPTLVVDPEAADDVAMLLSGAEVKNPGSDVLVLNMVGRDWFVHKDAATGTYKDAFAALLEALPADVPLTLSGKSVTVAEAATAWGISYQSRTFTDLSSSPYADAINHLATLDLVNGTAEGVYTPNSQLTRAQLCALLSQALGLWSWDSGQDLPFTDTPADAWYHNVVSILYSLGYVEGMGDGTFRPNEPVSNEQFLTILGRIGTQMDLSIWERIENTAEGDFAAPAVQKFSSWAQRSAYVAQLLDYTCKPLSEIDPAAAITREEAAATVYNLMHYMGIFRLTEDYEVEE